ncbi:unnamed protein product [Linum tenue]|uniref:Nucleolar pre-ribosomal-associated protein 1 n=1 Tax=Linum tenue TaxID=586396 RepID=A0AAV0H4G9_9ROSI|nr:unnamed protein product [Linum tenue]
MMEGGGLEFEEVKKETLVELPEMALGANHEAKLRELLHKINSIEIKLCSDATKEFIKLLKSDIGGEFLLQYVHLSSNLSELMGAWNLQQGKPGMSYILSLISAILGHPEGKYQPNMKERVAISGVLDRFARTLIEEKLDIICKELNGKEAKHQNAALLLLASIIRRGSGLASDVAKNFDFKLLSFVKLAEYKKKRHDQKRKHSTRKAFVGFGMSFLEVGKPGLLRWVLQQKEMYSGILRGLGNDDDETVIYVLSTLQNRILTEESLIPPALRSVLFGSVTLEQLVGISGRETGGSPADLAHNVLLLVCTDPSNGLMPDLKRHPNPLRGNPKRLLDLMKKLKATEIDHHRILLLEIVKRRPFLGAAYMEEIPYNLEDFASPAWFNMISLAANLVSSVSCNHPFCFIDHSSEVPPSSNNVDVQRIIPFISPRSFGRSVVNKGLLHSDFLVKNGTLRFVLEALKLLDSFLRDFSLSDFAKQSTEKWASVKHDIQNELRTLLPDPQVLLTLLSPLSSQARSDESGLKRKNAEFSPENILKRRKKFRASAIHEDDVIVGGISLTSDIALSQNDEIVDEQSPDELDSEKDYMNTLLELWGSDMCLTAPSVKDAETFFYAKLLDTLKVYLWVMPSGLETSFDFFMNILSNSLALPTTLQCSLLALLVEYVTWDTSSGFPISAPSLMYKHLQPFISLLIFSPIYDVKVHAYKLAQAAMFSTGAFDRNVNEIVSWFLFLPGFTMERSPGFEGLEVVQSLSQAVISFVCDATSTVGNSLFRHWDVLRNHIDQLREFKDLSPDFSPLSICVLQKSMRLLSSESVIFSLPEKSMISIYVRNTLKYLLQTQVDAGLLASLIRSVLTERLQECGPLLRDSIDSLSEWVPLKNLLLFAGGILQKSICCYGTISDTDIPTDISFERTIGEVKKCVESGLQIERTGLTKAFLAAVICAPPAELLLHFPSIMAILQDLQVPSMFLASIVFLEPFFMSGMLKLWPKIFFYGLDLAVSAVSSNNTTEQSLVEEMVPNIDADSEYASAACTFANLLRQAPFHVLFAATINFDAHHLSESSKLVQLLCSKLSARVSDSRISQLRLLLFWFNQIRSSYAVKPLAEYEQRSKVCHILIEHLLSNLLASESHSECCIDSVILPEVEAGEVANTVLCHPVVFALLLRPLSCNNECSTGDSSIRTFDDSFDALLGFCGDKIHKIDKYILKLVMTTVDNLFAVSNGGQLILNDVDRKRLEKALNNLVQTHYHELREKLNLCIQTEDWVYLVPSFYVCHALARILFPFELLELVSWVLGKLKMGSSGRHIGYRKSTLHIVFCLAADAFETLATYLQQGVAEGAPIHGTWELQEKCFDYGLIEEIYVQVCKYATEYELDSAYIFLLKAISAVHRQKHMQHDIVHPLSLVLTRIVHGTPIEVIYHCVSRTSRDKAKLLSLLVEISPLYSSVFGHFLLGVLNKESRLHDKVVHDTCSTIAEESYLRLLPASLSYLNSVSLRFQKQYCKQVSNVSAYYTRLLLNGFSGWKNFVCRPEFQESFDEVFPCSVEELFNLVNNSVLGKSICMLRYHCMLNGHMKQQERLKLFKTVCKSSETLDRLLDCDIHEIELYSVGESLNLINRVLGKISFFSLLLFPKDDQVVSLAKESNGNAKEVSLEKFSEKESKARIKFMGMLVGTWCRMVKKFPPSADVSEKERPKNCLLLYRFLEICILRTILQLAMEMNGVLIQLESIPFLDKLSESALLHRFQDPLTLKVLRSILASLSTGRFSCSSYLQRLLSHSQFGPIIQSCTESFTSQVGTFFKPLSSILRSVGVPLSNLKNELQQSTMYSRRLEIVKLLRVLILLHLRQCGSGGEIGINLKDLYLLLLSSYGATVCEVDLEIHSLMRKIQTVEESVCVDAAKRHYLWGRSALGMRKVVAVDKDPSPVGTADTEAVEEHQRNYYRENFPIDPRICAATVLHFPYQRTETDEPLKLDDSQSSSFEMYKSEGSGADDVQRYDPVFVLEFSVHTLSIGYIDPIEFAGLGLLAVAFVSISSPDVGLRKLGYETLGRYKTALEICKRKKETMGLRLLMSYIQNAIEEPWQRIPSVISLFAAESSFILLNSLNDHHKTLISYLENSSRVDMKKVPMVSSNSIHFRAERQWILRLIYAGLNSDEDGQMFIYNSIMKELLSFYSSPHSDSESKKLILLIVKKAVKLHKITHHLVKDCGLLSWLSSVLPISSRFQTGYEKNVFSEHLLAMVEVTAEIVSSRSVVEWLQNYALEQLMGLASHLYNFLVGGLESLKGDGLLLNSVMEVLVSTLKISQERKTYQPHFTLSFEGLVQVYRAYSQCAIATSCEAAELGLQMILMSIPSPDILLVEEATFSRFLMWAISVAMASDSRRRELVSKASQASTLTRPEEAQSESEECFLLKLQRWLVGAVILGKLSSTFPDARGTLSARSTSNLQSLLEYIRTGGRSRCELGNSREMLAASILYLQQLLCMDCSATPSTISALCLLLFSGTSQISDTVSADESLMVSLCSKVRVPPEANPAWRWSYTQAWKDVSSEEIDSLIRVEEYHACQTLSVIIANVVGKIPLESQTLSHQDIEKSGVFEWERSLIEG